MLCVKPKHIGAISAQNCGLAIVLGALSGQKGASDPGDIMGGKMTDQQPVTIICMKWGTLYGADYVNVLYNAVADNLTRPFQFVCLTDDETGILPQVLCHPIPDMGFAEGEFGFGGWPKLAVFKRDFFGLTGRALFVDLDTVIVGDITPMFDVPGGLVLIREWRRFNEYFKPRKIRGMSSVFAFDLGGEPEILETYLADPAAARASVRHEQAWLTKVARDMRFWPEEWVISFKRNLLALPLLNRFVPPSEPGPQARVLAFHGVPRPIDVVPDADQRWGTFWRYGRGVVPFVRNYWFVYGGSEPQTVTRPDE